MAVLGPCVSVNMNGHNNVRSQLTKSLERIIEDAYLSGELKLSGRKLKEFPKPVKYNLTDTVVADLSKNRFSELPDEVTSYVYLEKLFLSQNVIRTVPDAVGGLQSLTYLDLSSNQLTELPREICQMPLQVLLVSDNLLSSLPKEVGKMCTLAELDASVNRLTQVPMTLGDCVGMRALNLSNNQLGLLPLQITYLRLEHLDVSSNCISSLPLELRNMTSLVTLNLDHNPLVSPPTTVCMRGRVHIFKYLENMCNKDTLPSHKRVEETRRSTKHTSYLSATTPPQVPPHQAISGNATIDCLRHRPRQVVDSGYSTDGVDKRWCNDAAGEAGGGGGSGRSTPSTPSTLSPGTALSRAHSMSSETPLALSGFRISPEGTIGDDKSKLAHQQTYRQYKEALRQQRQQDVYRSRTDQSSPDLDSAPHSQNQSPVHFQRSQSSPHSPVANGYNNSNTSPSLYNRTISSNSSISSISPNTSQVPNSPLLHSTPRRYQNIQHTACQNGTVPEEMQNKRPVQKVVPSRSVNSKPFSNGNEYTNGRVNGSQRPDGESYIKPTSPTKSPTNTLTYRSITTSRLRREDGMNGVEHSKLVNSSMSYKGACGVAGKLPWNKDIGQDKLSFTMKREFDKQKEESDLLQQLRVIIESRLKMSLPEHLAPVLCDGVVLCHLANHVRPRSVASVHVPSPAQPKLTMARCRRNVDNFIEACRKIGVEEEAVCSAEDILSHHPEWGGPQRSPHHLAVTLAALLSHDTPPHHSQYQPPHDINHQTQYNIDPPYDNGTDVTPGSYHYQSKVYHRRYTEDRVISNFHMYAAEYNQYTIDETEEYQINYDNNNTELTQNGQYSPIYITHDGAKDRVYNYQNNKVQFVTPFYKDDGVLKSDHFEIYDTDEIDGPRPQEVDDIGAERYDRTKMNLNIENNLNKQLDEINAATKEERERTFQLTLLCLGSFFLSVIVLYLYPL